MDAPAETITESTTETIDYTSNDTYTEAIQQLDANITSTLTAQTALLSFQIALLFVVIFAIIWGNR